VLRLKDPRKSTDTPDRPFALPVFAHRVLPRYRFMRWIAASFLLGAATLVSASGAPLHVVSTDLCTDLTLLHVASPAQIRSVSRVAGDPLWSPLASEAGHYQANSGSVEELLMLAPDLALVYEGWTGQGHRDLLARRGIEVLALPYPEDWDSALEAARLLARRIGREPAVERRIARAEARLARLDDRLAGLRVLYLRPSGGSAGRGTYVDDLLTHLGLRNLAAEQGLQGWGRFPLEVLVDEPPDLFLLGYFEEATSTVRTGYGRHPVLRRLLQEVPSIHVPGAAWGCGGLELVEVAEQIVEQVEALSGAGP
jgi:iron complex transport system substrate-binding protein